MDLGFRCSTMIMVTTRARFPQKVRYPSVFDYAFVLTKGRPRHVNIIRDKPNRWVGLVCRQHVRERDGSLITRAPESAAPVGDFGDRSNVWHYHVGGGKTTTDKDASEHPALMPEKMAEDFIVSFSRPGHLVFDPMCGAGTTCKMALLNNRRYLGMEIYDEVRPSRKRAVGEGDTETQTAARCRHLR